MANQHYLEWQPNDAANLSAVDQIQQGALAICSIFGFDSMDFKHEACTWKTKTHGLVGCAKPDVGIWHCNNSEEHTKNMSPLHP